MNQEDKKRWVKSVLISLVIFFLFCFYLFLRRGYLNLYILNKAFASSAAVLAGATLLIGPLSKISTTFSSYMTIRRHLGLTAFGFAVIHIIASLIQQNRFPLFAWYLREWIPILFGIIAISSWIYMTYISRNSKIKELGVEKWKKLLSFSGQIAFIAIFLHLAIMKYPGWIRWFDGQIKQSPELANPSYPPASLFVFIIALFVIIFRLSSIFLKSKTP